VHLPGADQARVRSLERFPLPPPSVASPDADSSRFRFRPEGAVVFPEGAIASRRLRAILAKVCPDGWTGSVIQATLAADSAFSRLKPAPQIIVWTPFNKLGRIYGKKINESAKKSPFFSLENPGVWAW
jgi:hypothetical protein